MAIVSSTPDSASTTRRAFERYDGMAQDQRGVFRDEGPYIAWFQDPSGNLLSVLQER